MEEIFTPGGDYRDAMEVDGRRQIVREPDGIHLNGRGAGIAADEVLEAIRPGLPAGLGPGAGRGVSAHYGSTNVSNPP